MMGKCISVWLIFLSLLAGCAAPASHSTHDLVINEYLLSFPPDIGTDQLVFRFANGDQEHILAQTAGYRDYQAQVADYNSRVLAPFGYTIKPYHSTENGFTRWQSQIFHGNTILARDIAFMRPISVNSSGTDFIGWLDLETGGRYMFTGQGLEERPWPREREPYVYVGDQLLSIEIKTLTQITNTTHGQEQVSVYLDDALDYQTEMVPAIAPYGLTDGPWSYQGHWALVILDGKQDAQGNIETAPRLVQDGRDLNTQNGYEQSFQFAVLDGRPFYFYQREGKIDISFDGQEFAPAYDEIPHYECCSGGLRNPGISMNMVWFFARRGKDWYYVEAYVPLDRAQ